VSQQQQRAAALAASVGAAGALTAAACCVLHWRYRAACGNSDATARVDPETLPARVPQFEPPYTAVIFSSLRNLGANSDDGYAEMGAEMAALAEAQPGYLGAESSRDVNGFGLTVSYWQTAEHAVAWKSVARHRVAQRQGRDAWYRYYTTRVATVERCYSYGD
jgi:heme-degrading monooxygenase HmoA